MIGYLESRDQLPRLLDLDKRNSLLHQHRAVYKQTVHYTMTSPRLRSVL